MGDFLDFVKAIASLSLEIQENILFQVGEVGLYFDFPHKTNGRLRALITKNDGVGFVFKEAIKKSHKPLIQWLLKSFKLPTEYVLLTAVVYSDLFTLMHIIACIGDDYKDYDTLSIFYCISTGKISLLEYLYERNATFNCWDINLHRCIILGMHNSSEVCTWYLRNKTICFSIRKEILLQVYLENGDISRVTECLDSKNIEILWNSLSRIQTGKEEMFQWLIVNYSNDEYVLLYVAAACARIGHVDTLEVLFNEPYNVPIEYDMFAGIGSLSVAKVLHKYAYKRDSISKMWSHGRIKKLKSRFSTYRNLKAYRMVLETFKKSHRGNILSEEVLLFLVDLASITSSVTHTREYVVFAIQNGHFNLLRKLESYLQENDVRNLLSQFIYQSSHEAMIEYVLELGIFEAVGMRDLSSYSSLQLLQNLIQRELLLNDDGNPMEWNSETERSLQKRWLRNTLHYCPDQRPSKESQIALIRLLYSDIPSLNHYTFPTYLFCDTRRDTIASEISAYLQSINIGMLLKELQSNSYN